MSKVYAIRPHLYYQSGADNAVTPNEAIALIRKNIVATVGSRADAIKVLLMLGWKEDDIAFTMNYALHGGSGFNAII